MKSPTCHVSLLSRVKLSTNWPAPNVWVFIDQLLEHSSAKAEAMGSNPVKSRNFFRVAIALIAITSATIISSFKLITLSNGRSYQLLQTILFFPNRPGVSAKRKNACSYLTKSGS